MILTKRSKTVFFILIFIVAAIATMVIANFVSTRSIISSQKKVISNIVHNGRRVEGTVTACKIVELGRKLPFDTKSYELTIRYPLSRMQNEDIPEIVDLTDAEAARIIGSKVNVYWMFDGGAGRGVVTELNPYFKEAHAG